MTNLTLPTGVCSTIPPCQTNNEKNNMKTLIGITLITVSTFAGAVGIGNDNPAGNGTAASASAAAAASAAALASAQSNQRQNQGQGQVQGQGQQQGLVNTTTLSPSQTTTLSPVQNTSQSTTLSPNQNSSQSTNLAPVQSTTTSPTQTLTVNEAQPLRTVTIRNVPDAVAPSISPSANCFTPLVGAVAVAGLGISAGTAVEDKGCTRRENGRMLDALGERAAAVRLMCKDAENAEALGPEKCPVKKVASTAEGQCYKDEIVALRMNAPVCM